MVRALVLLAFLLSPSLAFAHVGLGDAHGGRRMFRAFSHAHGAEMPRSASGVACAIGFLAATGLLHLAGVGLGIALQAFAQRRVPLWSTMTGSAMALAGAGLLAGAF